MRFHCEKKEAIANKDYLMLNILIGWKFKLLSWIKKGHNHTLIDGVNSASLSITFFSLLRINEISSDMDDFGLEAIIYKDLLELTSRVLFARAKNGLNRV